LDEEGGVVKWEVEGAGVCVIIAVGALRKGHRMDAKYWRNYWSEGLRDNIYKLGGMEGVAVARFTGLVMLWAYMGFAKCHVLCGKRSLEEEQRLFGHGRSEELLRGLHVPISYARPGEKRIVWCEPGSSKHVQGRAADIDWGAYSGEQFGRALAVARELGFVCGADWKEKDLYHFEL
jgi:hypothetical protein